MLNGTNIKLRAIEPHDVDLLYKWENDFELWRVSNTQKPFSRNLLRQYIESEELDFFQTKQLRLMIDVLENNKTIGMIDLFDFDPYHSRAGVGIMLHKEFRNKGFALEALNVLCKYAFDFFAIHQLYCDIAETNLDSLNLFEKAGFVRVCEKKDWIFDGKNFNSVYFYQKINSKLV